MKYQIKSVTLINTQENATFLLLRSLWAKIGLTNDQKYLQNSTISGGLENPVAIGFALRAAILDERQNYSGTIFLASLQTAPRPLSSFDTHPRWLPVTQSARSRQS